MVHVITGTGWNCQSRRQPSGLARTEVAIVEVWPAGRSRGADAVSPRTAREYHRLAMVLMMHRMPAHPVAARLAGRSALSYFRSGRRSRTYWIAATPVETSGIALALVSQRGQGCGYGLDYAYFTHACIVRDATCSQAARPWEPKNRLKHSKRPPAVKRGAEQREKL